MAIPLSFEATLPTRFCFQGGFPQRGFLSFGFDALYKGWAAGFNRMQSNDVANLISRVAMGDRAAFSALYKATSPKLFGICVRILKNRAEAEEALQEIYIKVWQRASTFASASGTPSTWLATIARNHAIDTIRARKPVAEPVEEAFDLSDDSTPTPEQQAVLTDEGRRIDHCMGNLDAVHAKAVRSAYVDGVSYLELAEELKVPLNTVRTWLRRSLLKLRECLQR